MNKRIIAILMSFVFTSVTVIMSAGPAFAADPDDEGDFIFGTCKEYSTFTKGEFLEDTFCFSDSWFSKEPEERNDSLALVSMQLSASAAEPDADGTGAAFLKDLGFENVGFRGFDSDDPDDMAYTYATKQIGEGENKTTIVAVAVQSYSLDNKIKKKGWTQNFVVNGEETPAGEHYALSKAAESALTGIAGLSDESTGKVKYWIMGHSRGGALANLIAAKLPARLGARNNGVYAYTFESPATVEPEEGQDVENDYGYIHNYYCDDDVVTMVPPSAWGMKLYGKTYKLNTDEANAGMNAELAKIASDLEYTEGAEPGKAGELIEKLVSVIKTREAYSEKRVDTFSSLDDGKDVTVEYSYQDTLAGLMGIIFGDGIEVPGIADRLDEVLVKLDPYIRAYMAELGKYQIKGDVNAYYYKAAKDLSDELDSLDEETGNFPLKANDLYVLLKLAAPAIFDPDVAEKDPSCTITDDPMTGSNVMAYLLPGILLASDVSGLTFSHQFDGEIARLKVLAPAPALSDIALDIEVPQVRDSVSKASKDLSADIDELGLDWLDGNAKWITDDLFLKNNRKYYLAVTLYTAGHSAPESLKVTLGGKEPCRDPEISYKDGLMVVKAVFSYEFGEPAMYTVTFENDYGNVPKAVTVPAGTIMKYETKPDAGEGAGYEFGDWYDGETAWDDVTVFNDKYLQAKWIELITKADVSFAYPRAGQKLGAVIIPPDASYHIEEAVLLSEDSEEVTTPKKNQKLSVNFKIVPNSKFVKFAEEDGEFTGTVNVNGKAAEVYYVEEDKYFNVSVPFTAKGKVNPFTAKGKSVTVNYSRLKNRAQTVKRAKAVKISNAKGEVTYKKVRVGSAKINRKYGKKITVSKKSGKITVKKGLKKGTYKIRVSVRAAGDKTYDLAVKTVTVTLKVK